MSFAYAIELAIKRKTTGHLLFHLDLSRPNHLFPSQIGSTKLINESMLQKLLLNNCLNRLGNQVNRTLRSQFGSARLWLSLTI